MADVPLMSNPMTAVADSIIGGASGAPTRLAKGVAGANLAMGNGHVIWGAGNAFPASKATGDRWFRPDLGMEFFWDGTRWLTTTLYELQFGNQQAVAPWSASTGLRTSHPSLTLDMYAIDFWAGTLVSTTSSGTQYWTITNNESGAVLSTISNAANALVTESAAINAAIGVSTWLTISITKVSTPGTLFADPRMSYRLIGV